MNIIVNVDKNWGIGCENNLLFHISTDLKSFKSKTIGKVVVMGHKTLLTMPKQKPLEGRDNIILSGNKGLEVEGAVVSNSLEELFEEIKKYDSGDIFVIGGEAVYRQLLDYCDTAFITKTDADGGADRFFPNLDEKSEWELCETSEVMEEKGFRFTFNTYKRV